jgi:CRISPR-associated protein Csb1
MNTSELLDKLIQGIRDAAGIRRTRRLQPIGGVGDKIFPPTYPGEGRNAPPRHVFERRRIDGANVLCVLIDSVQSQANRLEEALQAARRAGKVTFPVIAVDFHGSDVSDIGQITTLEAPHRVFDAIIRDAELGKVRFKDTEEGKRLIQARPQAARAMFELAPTSLIFGAWNSTGEGGGLGAKFPRCVVSEIVGIGVAVEEHPEHGERPSGQRTGSRIDPLGIRSGVRVYKTPDGDWSFDKKDKATEVRPSEVNHSNIAPSVTPLGVSIDYAVHTFVLSFAALRRLRFIGNPGAPSEADVAGCAALAAVGLVGALAQDAAGYFLRSRCDLVPVVDAPRAFELVRADGTVEPFELTLDAACALVAEAVARAARFDLRWRDTDLVLKPQPKLVELVKQSREKALAGVVEDEAKK